MEPIYFSNSNLLSSVRYDENASCLYITYQKGRTRLWRAIAVPYNVYVELINSSSPGAYYTENIKHNYEHQPIS